jgi:dTDP-4-amino-4,6-dideoxygalactose transaminase
VAEYDIPFNRPSFVGNESAYFDRASTSGHISGDGEFTMRCQSLLEETLGVSKALLTTSCTNALDLSALLLEINPGDEVILPSFTFTSTANAFVLRGAKPVFADIRPDTLNIDEKQVANLASERTAAIVVVHYAGVGCEMDAIAAVADGAGADVVEDNAHGLFGSYRGRPLGTLGRVATVSFHETKNFSCGEGGALLLNDAADIDRAEILREKGTNRSQFFRGQADKYTWVDIGSSFLPSDLLAAILLAQLEERDRIQARRREIWQEYSAGLADWAATHDVTLPNPPPHCDHTSHLFFLLLPNESSRDRLIAHLKARSILSVFHYLPLHLSPMGRRFGGRPGDCPITEHVSARLVRLPLYYELVGDAQERVISAIREFDPAGAD